MARERKPEVGRPFHAAVTEAQMNAQFQTSANVNAISVTPPLTLESTPLGGLRFGIVMPRLVIPPAATGIRYGYVRDASLASKPYNVLVQFVKDVVTVDGESTLVDWVNDGDPLVVSVPPRFLATDFLKIVRTNPGVNSPFVRLDKEGGKWRISLQERWKVKERPPTGAIVRC